MPDDEGGGGGPPLSCFKTPYMAGGRSLGRPTEEDEDRAAGGIDVPDKPAAAEEDVGAPFTALKPPPTVGGRRRWPQQPPDS